MQSNVGSRIRMPIVAGRGGKMLEFDVKAPILLTATFPLRYSQANRLVGSGNLVRHGGNPQQLGYRGAIWIPF